MTTSGADFEVYDPDMASWIPLMLAEPEPTEENPTPSKMILEGLFSAESDASIAKRLLASVQEDWSGGMGLSYDWAPGLYTRSPGYACPAGAGTEEAVPFPVGGQLIKFEEYGNDIFVAQVGVGGGSAGFGRVFRAVNGQGPWVDMALPIGANEYCRGLLTADVEGTGTEFLYAFTSGGGVNDGRIHRWDGTSWVSTAPLAFGFNGRGPAAKVFWETADGVGASRIVTISGPRKISYTRPYADPMLADSWVEDVRISGSRGQLRNIAAAKTHVYLTSEDGLWDLDEVGNSPNLLGYIEDMVSPYNGYAAQYHDGAVFMSVHTGIDRVVVEQQGLLQELPGQCGPNWGTRAENPVMGWCSALTVDQGWLVAAIMNQQTRDTYICYGKSAKALGIESPNPMIWHGPEVVLENWTVLGMKVSSLVGNTRRLWLAARHDNGTVTTFWVSLPFAGSPIQNQYSLGTHKFANGASGTAIQPYSRLYTLPDTADDKASLKIIYQHALGTRGLAIQDGVNDGSGTKLVEYDRADPRPGSTVWGAGTDVTVSPSQTIEPNSPVKGHELGKRIDFISPNGAASTPQAAFLNSIRTTRWKVAPSFTVWTLAVRYGAGVLNLYNARGNEGALDPDYVTERLGEIIKYGPTTIRDRRDRRFTAKIEQVLNRETVFHDEPPGKTVKASLEITVIREAA